jgi:hypothetical protein
MDVPDPDDEEVMQFAGSTTLEESADDENAKPWCSAGNGNQHDIVRHLVEPLERRRGPHHTRRCRE